MDLHDLTDVLTAPGPFVTVHVQSESAVEQAADRYELLWKNVLRELEDKGVDERTREAVSAARGTHDQGESRLVIATTSDGTVRLAVSLASVPRRQVVDVAPLPHLLPLVDDVTTRVPHVVVRADHTGADVSAYYDTEHLAHEVTVKGHAPDIRRVQGGGWAHLHIQHRAVNGWDANAKEIVDAVVELAQQVEARLIVATGEERQLVHVARHLPTHLKDEYLEVPGGRGQDGSGPLVQQRVADAVSRFVAERTLDLLEEYTQERGQSKRAVDGLPGAVEALRKAQVQTLLVTTALASGAPDPDAPDPGSSPHDTAAQASLPTSTLLFGPDPTQLGFTPEDLGALGVDDPQEGPVVDVLVRAALGTAADVQVVPHEMPSAPQAGVGAVLRYADALTTGETVSERSSGDPASTDDTAPDGTAAGAPGEAGAR